MKKATTLGKCLNIAASARRSVNVKANDFVKKFGLEESKALVNAQSWTMRQIALSTTVDTKELTRLVESHELVESFGGLEAANTIVGCAEVGGIATINISRHQQAIADVESCQ